MKSLTLLFLNIVLLFYVNSFGQTFMKLEPSDFISKKAETTKKFANDYLTKQKNNSYFKFRDEALEELKNKLTEEKQKADYKNLKNLFGDYISLEYVETLILKDNVDYKFLRFKGDFEKSSNKLEIMVILNESDKVAGILIKPLFDINFGREPFSNMKPIDFNKLGVPEPGTMPKFNNWEVKGSRLGEGGTSKSDDNGQWYNPEQHPSKEIHHYPSSSTVIMNSYNNDSLKHPLNK